VAPPEEEKLENERRELARLLSELVERELCLANLKPSRTASIYPTADEINALPEKFRQYIHDLETRCDKTGDVQTIALLRADRDALQRRVEELEGKIKLMTPNRAE